jgi:hypothetical protein
MGNAQRLHRTDIPSLKTSQTPDYPPQCVKTADNQEEREKGQNQKQQRLPQNANAAESNYNKTTTPYTYANPANGLWLLREHDTETRVASKRGNIEDNPESPTRMPRTPSRTAGRTSSSSISGSSRPSESMQEYMTSDSESDRSSISSINFTGFDKLIGVSDGANASRPRFKNQERLAMMQRKASDNSETDSATTGSESEGKSKGRRRRRSNQAPSSRKGGRKRKHGQLKQKKRNSGPSKSTGSPTERRPIERSNDRSIGGP